MPESGARKRLYTRVHACLWLFCKKALVKTSRFCERVGTLGDSHRGEASRLRSCRHAATRMHRPARRKVGKTRLLADWQIVPRLGESSARACKGQNAKLRSQNFFTSAHTCEGAAMLLVTDFSLTKYRPHAQGHGHRGGLLNFAHTVSATRARGWASVGNHDDGFICFAHRMERRFPLSPPRTRYKGLQNVGLYEYMRRLKRRYWQGLGMGQTETNAKLRSSSAGMGP